jgi:hypothetical protein
MKRIISITLLVICSFTLSHTRLVSAVLNSKGASFPTTTPALPQEITVTAQSSPTSTPTLPPSATPLLTPTQTLSPTATVTDSPTLPPTATQTISEKLKTHIVFFLILPEDGRDDACGNISVEPIISQRYRTGDKVQDVQIALNMLFGINHQRYGVYYNALWNTQFDIQSYTYDPAKDYMTIHFGGYLPVSQLSGCDKHGIREQIWKTFYFYGFKEKTFYYYDKFFIDQLSRK